MAFANTQAALAAAEQAASEGIPYSTAIQSSGLLAGFRADCSGFVDYILAKSGYNVGGDTTVSLASAIRHGKGSPQGITLWDIPQPGQSGHVIIDIAGQWFESGGMLGKGPTRMTIPEVEQELGVSSLSQLTNGPTPRGFIPLSPQSSRASASVSLEHLWIEAGGPPGAAQTMAAIALAESGGKIDVKGGPNTNGTYDYGLWQINTVNVNSHHWSVEQLLHNPLYNARAAVAIYKSSGFGAWSSYNSGVYKNFLNQAGKASVNFGGVGGSRPRPSGSGASSGPDITEVLQGYESQYDTPGQGVGPDFVGLFGTPIPTPGDVWGAITGAITAPVDFFKFLVWLVNPTHILRMIELVVGLLTMAFALRSLVPRNSGLASSGSGIARVTQAVASATPVGKEVRMAKGAIAGKREGQVEHARLQARRASRQAEANRSGNR